MGFRRVGSRGWSSATTWKVKPLEPRSRRPNTSPTRLAQSTIDLIVELRENLAGKGLDHGPQTIAWHLTHHHGLTVSVNSIHRHLHAASLIVAQPQKRPKSSYIRFAAEQPNERWQADFTHWWLAEDTHVEILDWLDDHSRYALSVTAHRRVTEPIVLDSFRKAAATHGIPASTLTDNGMVFTTRLAGGKGGRNQLENELRRLGVTQINSTPNHPTTCGKVERFQQTLKRWLTHQPPAHTIAELQTHLDAFLDEYNHHRPHRSLPHQPPPIRPAPKQPREPASTPTTASAPTASTKPAPSPCAWPGACTTSASAHPLPNPRPDPRPGPQHQNHQRRHRRTPPRARPRPHQGLPTHRRPKGPTPRKPRT
jgi:transposase InsO family protein